MAEIVWVEDLNIDTAEFEVIKSHCLIQVALHLLFTLGKQDT